jgi:hypothetical protein
MMVTEPTLKVVVAEQKLSQVAQLKTHNCVEYLSSIVVQMIQRQQPVIVTRALADTMETLST